MIECNQVELKKHDEFVKLISGSNLLSIGINREKIGHQSFSTVSTALAFLNQELKYNQENPNKSEIFGDYFYTSEAIAQINSIIGTLNQFNNL